MRKNIYLLSMLVVALFTLPLSAQQVSMETARMRASAFLNKAAGSAVKKAPRKAPQLSLVSTSDELYIFNDDANGSHIIMSSDERMPEVLGYSYEGTIDSDAIPCNMQAWLDDCAAQVRWLREHPEVAAERRKSPQKADIAPLLTCQFNQGYPYNLKCPEVDGERCVTGCTATAMAQIMHYWQWPKKTTFTIPAYTTGTLGIEMPAIPPTTIDWDKIVRPYTDETRDVLSTLMVLCGTAVKMDYEPSGSSALATPAAYDLLDYDITSMQRVSRRNYSDADWEEMLYNELQQQRPISYAGFPDSGDGHAFVIDGYQYHDDAYWHVNWGWGGGYVVAGTYYEQQYYTLDNMEYNNGQRAVIGIQPASNERLYALDETGGKTTLYYDTEASSKGDKARPYGYGIGTDVTEVEFHPSMANCKPKTLSFSECTNLKQIKGIEYLNTEEMTDMSEMFLGCSSLTSLDLSSFNTEKVTDMNWMFSGCKSLTSLDVSNFNTENVTNMGGMFNYCSSLTSLDLSSFNTANVTDMSWMFRGCGALTSLDLSNFNTEKVTDMSNMFIDCGYLKSLNLSNFNTENVTKMSSFLGGMFSGCSSLTSLDLSSFNTEKVTDMREMFSECSSLTSLDLSSFNTANVTNMRAMFSGCSSLTSLDLSSFNTANVTNISSMFSNCHSLTSLNLSNFNTANVTDMGYMFPNCISLTSLDLSSFNTANVTNMSEMFFYCRSLKTISVSNLWDTSNVSSGSSMFAACYNLKGGAGTVYDSNNTGLSYAHVDGGPSNPGYLTYKTPTAIKNMDAETNATAKWYTLDGKRLYGKPVTKGVYIVKQSNGTTKKVMVK
ncbi:MAG: BspA family leucine-rich repeat surface protein [Bacteroidaceae bacterium]|nr:BspA family leucine-rich repeat surface protein [Bacteroidaceae bacterium]